MDSSQETGKVALINTNTDPYAPPPMHHDNSGRFVRVVLLGGMLGAAALGYAWLSDQGQPTSLAPPTAVVQDQRTADAGYRVSESASPEATPTTAAN